jgi:hypothetical protein
LTFSAKRPWGATTGDRAWTKAEGIAISYRGRILSG